MVSSRDRMAMKAVIGVGDRVRTRAPGATLLCALALAAAGPPVRASAAVSAPLPGATEIPVKGLIPQLAATGPVRPTPSGFAVDVNGWFALFLPLAGAEVVEIDYQSKGPLLLSWGSSVPGQAPAPKTPPWHHRRLEPGTGRATLDFRATAGWGPRSTPLLLLEGSGTVAVNAIRVRRTAPGADAWRGARDEAVRWSPLWIGHSTINWLDEPLWSASTGLPLTLLLGGAFLVLSAGGAAAWAATRRRWRPAPALAISAVVVSLLFGLVFAGRIAPSLLLRPRLDPASRLRENFVLAPATGAVVAVARDILPEGARVGVQASATDWFAWESVCFHLAPRPCVQVKAGEDVHGGLPGAERLTAAQLDAVVYLHADEPLLPGFAPAASVGQTAFVARRR